MSFINHEAGLAGVNVNHVAEPLGPVHAPAPPGGCTPPTCGPSSGGQKEMTTPQAILGLGPRGGLGDEGSFGGALLASYLYKGEAISPHISPSAEVSASAKTKETSVAAMVREIAMAASREFTVDEITKDVVKSPSISPHPATPEEWQPWRTRVSNTLGRLAKQGLLERVQGKKGTYRRASTSTETDQADVVAKSIIPETPQVEAAFQKDRWLSFREANRMKPPETPGEPLTINLPLHLEREFRVFAKNIVVVGAVTNSCKTTLAINLARMNMNINQVTYINSEMSEAGSAIVWKRSTPGSTEGSPSSFSKKTLTPLTSWANRFPNISRGW